jgi:hypothetical protein
MPCLSIGSGHQEILNEGYVLGIMSSGILELPGAEEIPKKRHRPDKSWIPAFAGMTKK